MDLTVDVDLGGFLPAGHAMVLGMTATGASLASILTSVAELVELEITDCSCSIMLIDAAGLLQLAAAPSLPLSYVEALSPGVPVEPGNEPLGRAVTGSRPVVVADLRASAQGSGYLTAALDSGLQACWAVAILGDGQRPLGVFAMYYTARRTPAAVEIQRLGGYAQLVAVAVQRDQAQRQLEHAKDRDHLTGLPSTDRLPPTLQEALQRCRFGAGESLLLATIDVGRLEECNQALGYSAGDELVRQAGQRITAVAGRDAHVFRTGGGKFTMITSSSVDDDRSRLPHQIVRALAAPYTVAGVGFTADPHGGVVACREPAEAQALLSAAMTTLQAARSSAGPRVMATTVEDRNPAADSLALENDLRRGLTAGELTVHYQPLFRLDSGVMVGMEALVRWDHPQRGLLLPGLFLPAIDRGRLHAELLEVVLPRACADAARWRAARPDVPFAVGINISAPDLRDPDLVPRVRQALVGSGLPGAAVCIEVTERDLVSDIGAAARTLAGLKALGCKIAMDDFGTGYSSLAHARHLPVDYLKVDRSFVQRIDTDPYDAAVVAAVVGLADGLGLDVIAEGVETPEQFQTVRDLGCRTAQGFLWSPAVPAEHIDALLASPGPPLPDTPHGRQLPAARWRPDIDDIIADVVHEARHPIAVLQLAVGTLDQHGLDEATKARTIAAMARQLDALDGILSTASDARDLDRGAVRLSLEPLDLTAFLTQATADLAASIPTPTRVEPTGRTIMVRADRARVQQICANLLANASRYSPPGEPVTLRLRTDARHAHLDVEDRGPGVPTQHVGLIFRKYARVDHTGPGLGLGLYIARQLARSHGGDLTYQPAQPHGARFTLHLPLDTTTQPRR